MGANDYTDRRLRESLTALCELLLLAALCNMHVQGCRT